MMQHTASPDPSAHHAVFSATALLPRYPRVPDIPATGALWVLVSDQGVAIGNGEHPQIYAEAGPSQPGIVEYLGHIGTVPCYAAELQQGAPIPGDRVIIGIRDLYGRIPDRDLAVAAFAVRTIGSSKTSRFCGRCGHETLPVLSERAKRCPACDLVIYPRISPAIIVLITRGEEILLARSPRSWP